MWSVTYVHPLTFDILCGVTKSRGEGEVVLPCGFGPFWGTWSATSLSLVQLWYGRGSLCNSIYCQRIKKYGWCFCLLHLCNFLSLTVSQSRHCETLLPPNCGALRWATHCITSTDFIRGMSLCSCIEMCSLTSFMLLPFSFTFFAFIQLQGASS